MMKKITILWALLVNMVAFAQVTTNGLVGYWPFNGNANDASGNSRNGAVSGATLATGKSGIANTAYYFNGSSTINLSNTSSLPLAGNTDWTIYARSKISNGGGGPLFMKQTSSATTIQYVWILGSSNNTITGGLGTDSFINGGWANTLNTSNPQNSFADNWNSNFIVKRGDTTYFYTENKLAYKTKFAWLDRPVGDQNIVLGRTWFDNWHLIGFIDEFAIWNRVLNIAEIMQVAGIVNQTIAGFSLPQTLNYSASPICLMPQQVRVCLLLTLQVIVQLLKSLAMWQVLRELVWFQ